jgi:hypothetical protein
LTRIWIGGTARAVPVLLGAVAVLALLLAALAFLGPNVSVFSDAEELVPTEPPTPRNACEREFASLTDGLGISTTPVPKPPMADLVRVMNACTATELFAADRRFDYVVGGPMTALLHRVFFNGPDAVDQLRALCASRPALAQTKACADGDPAA